MPASIELPDPPLFDEERHVYRDPADKRRLVSLSALLKAGGFTMDWWGDEQAMLRGRRVHAACHYYDEGDLNPSTVIEPDRGYLAAWQDISQLYEIQVLAVERPVMLGSLGVACRPDLLCIATINGSRLYCIVERKSGTCPPYVRYQLAGQQMMCPDPFKWTRIAFELHSDGTWKAVGPWFPSTYLQDKSVIESCLRIYRAKEELRIL